MIKLQIAGNLNYPYLIFFFKIFSFKFLSVILFLLSVFFTSQICHHPVSSLFSYVLKKRLCNFA